MSDNELQLEPDEARIDAILRSMTLDDLHLEEPPLSLWSDIEAAMNDVVETPAQIDSPQPDTSADVIDLTSRFRRGPAFIAAAAAAVVLIVGAVVVTAGDDEPAFEVVGEAELGWQEGFVEEGVDRAVAASILDVGDSTAVRIDEADLPARADEDLELWLIGVDEAGELTIQTLGVIENADEPGTYTVPASFDPDAYETVLVDISYEPRDGVETHSGASIVRGPISDA